MTSRSEQLLTDAAEAYLDGRDPFSTDWLIEHQVTRQECAWLTDQIGRILHGFVRSSSGTQRIILTLGTTYGMPELNPVVIESTLRRGEAMGRISALEGGRK